MKKPASQQSNQVEQAIKVLQQGGIIAYPTEAVYGLGCNPDDLAAVKKILRIKQREKDKGLILIAASFDQIKPYIQVLEKNIEEKLLVSWRDSAKPITWLVPVKSEISDYLTGQFDTLAVRVSKHPLVKELCEKFGGAIVSTSANRAKQEAARTSDQVEEIFEDEIDFILEGETDPNAQPSEIRDALTNKV
ncbi:MAG: L-threonylcarbamoyladenylate synthase, partial [Gammaproteobacteria bacterium]|nr:L-threonylcarbamoyladenylate synthase [Gammaproteobacteria bacterium]